MNISIRKLKTLLKKDFYDALKNPSITISFIVPILFIMVYKGVIAKGFPGNVQAMLLSFGMLMNTGMNGTLVASTTIAEEKEKFTLRTLLLSNVGAMEFFVSKIIMAATITLIGNIVIFAISGQQIVFLPYYILFTLLGAISMVMLSGVIGLVSRDQMSCGVLQMPLLFLFMLPGFMAEAGGFFSWLARLTPLTAALSMYNSVEKGSFSLGRNGLNLAVIIGWIVISAIVFGVLYKRKGIDN